MKNEDEITLGVLSSVHDNHEVTQRNLSNELGIALGLTNAYLKRCVRKGLIKVQQIPRNRYAYYLTADGFSEKSRLTAQYLTSSFHFYRRARGQCEALLLQCKESGISRITIHSISDLTDIAILCASRFDVEIIGIIATDSNEQSYHGRPIYQNHQDAGAFDAIMLADLNNAQAAHDTLCAQYPDTPVLAPELLRISKKVREA